MRRVILPCLLASGCGHQPSPVRAPVADPTPFGQHPGPAPAPVRLKESGALGMMIAGGVMAGLGVGGVAYGLSRPKRSVTAEFGQTLLVGLGVGVLIGGATLITLGAVLPEDTQTGSQGPTSP